MDSAPEWDTKVVELKEWAKEFVTPLRNNLGFLESLPRKMKRYLHLECSDDGGETEKFWGTDLNALYLNSSSVHKSFNFGKIK